MNQSNINIADLRRRILADEPFELEEVKSALLMMIGNRETAIIEKTEKVAKTRAKRQPCKLAEMLAEG